MKSFITATLLSIALAAPTLQKRREGTVTLFTDTQYQGQSMSFTIDLASDDRCRALPAGLAGQISSIKLSPTDSYVDCQLTASEDCSTVEGMTWFFNWDVPDLKEARYDFDNRTMSFHCADNGNPAA
ncbi:hypothetical protein P154DRAFT_623256 [Amniculicola lignicola CBS 123094]|uniref:AA1-like domain-containing protein n=1 Tax=Amniculicola lignicola CBS 123094 TaxID=1392246 RepID=A0A6A5W397_9PLEO|nr:hypothetical protein P154DRAFT_623256 [Amniculicola lignicola CBS 123094]